LTVFAFADAGHATLDAGEPVTGDAANITAQFSKDDGAPAASNDTNPTESDATDLPGYYDFDLTQAESNCDKFKSKAKSSTAGVQVVTMPSGVIYTRPPNFSAMGIESDGDLTKVNALHGHTPQTGDTYAEAVGSYGFEALCGTGFNTSTDSAEAIRNYLETNLGAAGANATEAGGTGDQFTGLPAMTLTAGERTTLAAAIEAAIINELDGQAVMQAIADLIAGDMTTGDLSVQAIAAASRDAVLDRVLSGNHDDAGTLGKLAQKLNVSGTLAHSDAADTYKAISVTVSDKTGFALAANGLDGVTLPADLITAASINTGALTADAFAAGALVAATFAASSLDGKGDWNTTTPQTAAAIAGAVWDETLADHLGAGSTGNALNAAGAAGDPWSTALPGAYGAGTAGKIVGDNLNATVSSRSSHNAAAVVSALGTGSTLGACLTATGFSTFNPTIDKVYLGDGAHGGSSATFVLSNYSNFQGAAGGNVTVAANGLDGITIEGDLSLPQAMALILAALAGNIEDVGDDAPKIRAAGGSAVRISATTDSDGNRTVIALTPPE
jgi:hypothetical protein